uniref:FH2 domain-containing protein n=1 Tax=Plectus sambesii TaxID=2011161 RepID=A0A914WWS6_9BILA
MDGLSCEETVDWLLEDSDGEALFAWVEAMVGGSEKGKLRAVQSLSTLTSLPSGQQTALKCLSLWQDQTDAPLCLQPLVDELRHSDDETYLTALLALINGLVDGADGAVSRFRIRAELLGLKLSPTLDRLRGQAKCSSELGQQVTRWDEMKLLDEQMATDEAASASLTDLFSSIVDEIGDGPNEPLFGRILRHLLRIDCRLSSGDLIWSAVDQMVSAACTTRTEEAAERLLSIVSSDTMADDGKCRCSCHKKKENDREVAPAPPPPPPPPPLPPDILGLTASNGQKWTNSSELAKKLPFSEQLSLQSQSLGQSSGILVARMTKPVVNSNPTPRSVAESNVELPEALRLGAVPQPTAKLKQFAWNKIPVDLVTRNGGNVWIKTASRAARIGATPPLDFGLLDQLFCCRVTSNIVTNNGQEKRDTVNLLASKRSLNVNIFLKQFRGPAVDALIADLQAGAGAKIGLERLRALAKTLPDQQEIDILQSYTGDISRLGNAERFFLQLIKVPYYGLRIEGMVLKGEFSTVMDSVRPSVDSISAAANELKSSRALQDVLLLVLQVGNYLNSGTHGGNAVGIKLSSLWKVAEIRANRPNMTLLHFIAAQTQSASELVEQMPHLEPASKYSLENIRCDVRTIAEKAIRVAKQIEHLSSSDPFFFSLRDFLESAKESVAEVEKELDRLNAVRLELADFFCEDATTFKLEECFKIFEIFVTRLTKAAEDNKERKAREEKAEQRQMDITHGGGIIHSASAGDLSTNGRIRRRPSLAEILESDDCHSPSALDSPPAIQREYRSGSLRRTNRRRAALWATDQDRDRTSSAVIVGRNRSGSARSDGSDPPPSQRHSWAEPLVEPPVNIDKEIPQSAEPDTVVLRHWRVDRTRRSFGDSLRHSGDLENWLSSQIEVNHGDRPSDRRRAAVRSVGGTPSSPIGNDESSINESIRTVRESAETIEQIASAQRTTSSWEQRKSVRDSGIEDSVAPSSPTAHTPTLSAGDEKGSSSCAQSSSSGQCSPRTATTDKDEGFETESLSTAGSLPRNNSPDQSVGAKQKTATSVRSTAGSGSKGPSSHSSVTKTVITSRKTPATDNRPTQASASEKRRSSTLSTPTPTRSTRSSTVSSIVSTGSSSNKSSLSSPSNLRKAISSSTRLRANSQQPTATNDSIPQRSLRVTESLGSMMPKTIARPSSAPRSLPSKTVQPTARPTAAEQSNGATETSAKSVRTPPKRPEQTLASNAVRSAGSKARTALSSVLRLSVTSKTRQVTPTADETSPREKPQANDSVSTASRPSLIRTGATVKRWR